MHGQAEEFPRNRQERQVWTGIIPEEQVRNEF